MERVVAYCSRALRPSQRRYCTTKREILAAVAMCIQFRSYLRGAKFTFRTDHKSLVWLHRFKDMMARWLHDLQQFQFSGRAGTTVMRTVCRESLRLRADSAHHRTVRRSSRFPSVPTNLSTLESTGSSEDADLVPIHLGEDWIALLDDDLSQPSTVASASFRISTLQKEDRV